MRILTSKEFAEMYDGRERDRCPEFYANLWERYSTLKDAVEVTRHKHKLNLDAVQHTPAAEDFPRYTMTTGGKLWVWNCGWQQIDRHGKHIGQPIGWMEFRKIKKIRKRSGLVNNKWMAGQRPHGPWRRIIDSPYTHWLYGTVHVKLTDGVHALIWFWDKDGNKRHEEVHFTKLIEQKIHATRVYSRAPKSKSKTEISKDPSAYILDLL